MATTRHHEPRAQKGQEKQNRESGNPGGGRGQRDEVGHSGVSPASGPLPPGEGAVVRSQAEWGQGERGAAGAEDHGDSEMKTLPPGEPPVSAEHTTQGKRAVQRKRCRDVMTPDPVCCPPDALVNTVAQLMTTEDIGPVLVVENWQTKKLIGIVTDRDLATKVVAEGRDPNRMAVAEVMTREPIVCCADDAVQTALDLMAEQQVRRIPVVDDRGQVLGIIAQADVATRVEEPGKTAAVVEEISKGVENP
jgi:CBS domain-containing protein